MRRAAALGAGLLCVGAVLALPFAACRPAPAPTPGPTPTASTEPTPDPSCYAPTPGPAGDYVPVTWRPSETLWAVIAAREVINPNGCWPHEEDVPLEALAAELRRLGHCAVKDEDRVMIMRADGLFEEQHAIAYTTGCWAKYPYKGTLAWIGAAQ